MGARTVNPMTDRGNHIGANIRARRKALNLNQEQLAGLTGYTKGYVSKVENGHAAVDLRSTLVKFANGLRCSVADLTGSFVPTTDTATNAATGSIPDIQFALVSSSLSEPRAKAQRTMDELGVETTRLAELRQACKYERVGNALPALLTDLHAVAAGGRGHDRVEALRSVVIATQVTTLFVKNLGHPLLGYLAAQRGCEAATLLDDPLWMAVAEFAHSQALIGMGVYDQAEERSRRAKNLVNTDSDAALQVYATSILSIGFCQVTQRTGTAAAAIEEARGLAQRVKNPNKFFLGFDQSNVDLWDISQALEAEDPVYAADVAKSLDPESILLRSRRAAFFIDHARALFALRPSDPTVVELLRRAEKLAPVRTRKNVFAREIVGDIFERARRDAGGTHLLGLADRMGLVRAV